MSGEKLQIGFVTRAHGVRGMVRVRATSDVIVGLKKVFVAGRELTVEQVMPERGEFLVQLEGVRDRDAAEALRGSAIEIPRELLPPAGEDELYVADLIGCLVVDVNGRELGAVRETFDSGAHEVLVVAGGAREFMLPLIDEMVTAVDLQARRITCDPPPGLIDPDEAERG